MGGFGRQGQSSGRQAVPRVADNGQRPPGRDEGQAGEESTQGEAMCVSTGGYKKEGKVRTDGRLQLVAKVLCLI